MILFRYILIVIAGYLVIRAFVKFSQEGSSDNDRHASVKNNNSSQKKVSKEIGEYVDYEEIKK
jgi:hypothetical protein